MGPDDALDPRYWPLDVPTARAIWAADQKAESDRLHRKARMLFQWQLALLIERALAGGARRVSEHVYEWDVSGGCRNTRHVDLASTGMKGRVTMLFACRTQCEACLGARKRLWSARALTEARRSHRTWQITLTARPDELYRAQCIAMRETHRFGLHPVSKTEIVRWADLTPGDQFGHKVRVLGEDVTRWLKRVRKRCVEEWVLAGATHEELHGSFRYLLVVEAHKSGEPHWHLLLHETSPDRPIRYDWLNLPPRRPSMREWWMPSQVDARWALGFSNFKLKPADEVTYVTKYLTKSLLARVRASKRYGEHTPAGEKNSTPTEENPCGGEAPAWRSHPLPPGAGRQHF